MRQRITGIAPVAQHHRGRHTAVVLLDKEREDPGWEKVPKTPLLRAVRSSLSPRTPYFYKLAVLVTSGYLVIAASLYTGPTQVVH